MDGSCSYQLGKHWERGDWIGQGISGTCYIGTDWVTRSRMVVKQVCLTDMANMFLGPLYNDIFMVDIFMVLCVCFVLAIPSWQFASKIKFVRNLKLGW